MWTSNVLAFERNNFGLVKVTHPERQDRSMQRCKSIGPQRISVLCWRWYSSVITGFSFFCSMPILKSILSSTGVSGLLCWPILFIFCFSRVTWIVGNSWQNASKVNRTSTCPMLPSALRGRVSSNTCSSQVVLIRDRKNLHLNCENLHMSERFFFLLLTHHSATAKFSCDADLPIDEDAADGAVAFEPAPFHSNTEEQSHCTQGNVDRIS